MQRLLTASPVPPAQGHSPRLLRHQGKGAAGLAAGALSHRDRSAVQSPRGPCDPEQPRPGELPQKPFPSGAAPGRLRTSRGLRRPRAPAPAGSGARAGPAGDTRGGRRAAGRRRRHRPRRGRSHPGTSGGRRRGGRGRGGGGGRRAGAAARPITAALSSVQTGAQWSERRARCSQACRGRRAADGPACQWAPAAGGRQPMGAGRGRARARLGCPCRVLG